MRPMHAERFFPRVALAALTRRRGHRGAARSAAQEKPNSQVPTLGRPTKPDDPAPVLDFLAYFKGAWNVTWDYPESPLGPADVLTGTTTYRREGPDDASRRRPRPRTRPASSRSPRCIEYQREAKTIARTVTDSRGFAFTQKGTVAGDLGGQFIIRLEARRSRTGPHGADEQRDAAAVALNYRTQSNISVDGGPFTNFGNPVVAQGGPSR